MTDGGVSGTVPGRARRRVLFLSHDMVWPAIGGGRIRCITILRRTLPEVDVDLVVVAPRADVERDRGAVAEMPGLTTHVFEDESDQRLEQFQKRWSPGATRLVGELASRNGGYDAVHIEGHFLWPVVPEALRDRTVVVEQNVESQKLAQCIELGLPVTGDDLAALRAQEEDVWRRAGAIVALTPEDASQIRDRTGVEPHLVPNGWDHLPARTAVSPDGRGPLATPRLLFYGDYDYGPNRDGLAWLLDEVLPRIRRRLPGARLVIGGINMTPDVTAAVAGVAGAEPIGFIDDLTAELDRADVVLCPLRWGGGVKVKIIEALRRSCLIVATTKSSMGIPAPMRSAVALADDPEDFADEVARLCRDEGERSARRARIAEHQGVLPTWDGGVVRTMELWWAVADEADRRAALGGS